MKNRSLTLILLAGATLGMTACVGPDANLDQMAPLSPLSRYMLKVEPGQDRIALAVHDGALSSNQQSALSSLAYRYNANGRDGLVIEVPEGNDPVAIRSAQTIAAALQSAGVPAQQIQYATYASPNSRAPVVAGFATLTAEVPRCGTEWGNLSRTGNNAGSSNFGCSVNANLAAQIADPRDIVAPRAMTPANAQRRTVVFEAYRQGQPTSAARETLITGSQISEAVN